MNNKPKIAFWDIETTPNIATIFSLKNNENIHYQNIQQERYIICGSWKWLGDKKVYSTIVNSKSPKNDKKVLVDLRDMLTQADAIVAHYGDNFDMKFFNSRLAYYSLPPAPPVKQVDTYKLAKKSFLFNSNTLDYLSSYFKIGKKTKVNHQLWIKCMQGDSSALKEMLAYNRNDVVLLEKVYEHLSPYGNSPLNFSLFYGNCQHCGSDKLSKRGFLVLKSKRKQRLQCQNCGCWSVK